MRLTASVPLGLSPQVQQAALPMTEELDPVRYRGVEFDRDGNLSLVYDRPDGIAANDEFKRVGVVRAGDPYDEDDIPPAAYFGSARHPATGQVYLVFLFDVPQ